MSIVDEYSNPHKLFAVLTNPDGNLYYRKMWSVSLAGYLSGIGAIQLKGWEEFLKNSKVGQVWHVPVDDKYSWMVLIRIQDSEDHDDTA